jgi:hypothetical protein
MAAPEKPSSQRTTTPPAAQVPQPAQAPAGKMGGAIRDTAVDFAKQAIFEKRPYLKFAFQNPYNLSLFAGALAAAGLTLNPVLALAAVGAEAIWLLYAPDSRRLQHLLWDPKFEKIRDALAEQERNARMVGLADHVRSRVQLLVRRQHEIRELASRNPSFTADLLKGELVKTDKLVDAFIDMAVTCARYEQYLTTVDVAGVERERGRWEKAVKAPGVTDPEIDIAKKNLAILGKRLDKVKEIRRYLDVARGQLDLIENSFQLIGDQIVTMQSPQELSGQLNDLLAGVESIEQSAADTERLLNSLGITA